MGNQEMKVTGRSPIMGKGYYAFIILGLFYPIVVWFVMWLIINGTSIAMAFNKIDIWGNWTFVGFDNFKNVINMIAHDGDIVSISFVNSIKTWFLCLIISMPLYLLFSYYIFKKAFGARTVQTLSMVPRLVPGMVYSLTFMIFMEQSLPQMMEELFGYEMQNLFTNPDTRYGILLFYTIWLSFSSSLIYYPNAMNSIQPEVIESAKIDGVDNIFYEMWHIVLPLIYPTICTFLVTGVAGIFANDMGLVTFYLYSAKPDVYNVSYYIFVQVKTAANETIYPTISAMGLMMTAVMAPLTFLVKWALEKFGPSEE